MNGDRAVRRELAAAGGPARAAVFRRFFKTGPGEYAEGDRFRGVTVPAVRAIVRRHPELDLDGIDRLLRGSFHEERLAALLALVRLAERKDAGPEERDRLAAFYLARVRYVNNWDLVDLSAPALLGRRLVELNDPAPLFRLVRSSLIWERRVGVVAVWAFIRAGRPEVAFDLAATRLEDPHDLLRKATGWMLREAGKRDPRGLDRFLDRHAAAMPRVMLRYAIERLPPAERRRRLAVPRTP